MCVCVCACVFSALFLYATSWQVLRVFRYGESISGAVLFSSFPSGHRNYNPLKSQTLKKKSKSKRIIFSLFIFFWDFPVFVCFFFLQTLAERFTFTCEKVGSEKYFFFFFCFPSNNKALTFSVTFILFSLILYFSLHCTLQYFLSIMEATELHHLYFLWNAPQSLKLFWSLRLVFMKIFSLCKLRRQFSSKLWFFWAVNYAKEEIEKQASINGGYEPETE